MSIVITASCFLCFQGNNGFFQGTLEDLWWRVQIVRESTNKTKLEPGLYCTMTVQDMKS